MVRQAYDPYSPSPVYKRYKDELQRYERELAKLAEHDQWQFVIRNACHIILTATELLLLKDEP